MASLGLTTANNYQTLVINGTTIKKLYAKRRNSDGTITDMGQIYQKWKDQTVTTYGSEYGMRCTSQLAAYSQKYKNSGWGSSYVTYYFQVRCDLGGWTRNNGAYFRTRYYDPGWTLRFDVTRYTSSGSSTGRYNTSNYNYTSVYRRNDSSYDRKSYTGYIYVNMSESNGSGGTRYATDIYASTSTPSVTEGKSYSNYSNTSWQGGDCYIGTTSTSTQRVKDE